MMVDCSQQQTGIMTGGTGPTVLRTTAGVGGGTTANSGISGAPMPI